MVNSSFVREAGKLKLRHILLAPPIFARLGNDRPCSIVVSTGSALPKQKYKDAPISRPIQRTGSIKSFPILGGLHHHYVRV
jgi:hypothetical protein